MNQGAVAGAGIAAHLHQHVVPRWGGDPNFMPIIGQTKTLPQLLDRHPGPARRRLVADRAAEPLACRAPCWNVSAPSGPRSSPRSPSCCLRAGDQPDAVTVDRDARASAPARSCSSRRGEFLVGVAGRSRPSSSPTCVDGLMARMSGQSSQLGRVPRLDAGPVRRRGDLRRPRAVLRRAAATRAAGRAGDLTAWCSGVGHLLRPGPRRGARDARPRSGSPSAPTGWWRSWSMTGLAGPARPAGADRGRAGALAVASTVTVVQRMLLVRSQARRPPDGARSPSRAGCAGCPGPPRRPPTGHDVGYLAGWRLVRLLPERRRTRCSAGSPTRSAAGDGTGVQPAAGQPAPGPARTLVRAELDALTARGGPLLPALLVRVVPAARVAGRRRRTAHPDRRRAPPARRLRARAAGSSSRCRTWATGTGPAPGRAPPGCRCATVAERLKPERLYDEFVAYREHPRHGDPAADRRGRRAAAARASGCAAADWSCLLADRDLSRTGVEVDLCGAPGPDAARARRCSRRRTGAPLLPGDAALRRRRTW